MQTNPVNMSHWDPMENAKSHCDFFSVFQAAAEGRTAGNAAGNYGVEPD